MSDIPRVQTETELAEYWKGEYFRVLEVLNQREGEIEQLRAENAELRAQTRPRAKGSAGAAFGGWEPLRKG